jgi:hypothetical protein
MHEKYFMDRLIVSLVQVITSWSWFRLPQISVGYSSSCTVASWTVRVKSSKIVVILSHRKDWEHITYHLSLL